MSDGNGLDKSARRAAERAERAEADRPAPLEPRFPYRCEPFDPTAFGLPANLPESEG